MEIAVAHFHRHGFSSGIAVLFELVNELTCVEICKGTIFAISPSNINSANLEFIIHI